MSRISTRTETMSCVQQSLVRRTFSHYPSSPCPLQPLPPNEVQLLSMQTTAHAEQPAAAAAETTAAAAAGGGGSSSDNNSCSISNISNNISSQPEQQQLQYQRSQ
jgi:hypothetical protein